MQKIPTEQIPVYQHDPNQVNGKIYVRLTQGFYQNLRRLISGSLMLMFFATTWINLNGEQIVLFDFYSRRIHLFGLMLSPEDLWLLAGFMIIGAVLLFAMAMAYSRIWCGFACPQSIWTWVFIRIEELVEGSRNHRIKQDHQRLYGSRLLRRLLKHGLWLLFAAATAVTFISYFVPVREISADIFSLRLSLDMIGWITIFTLLTYINAGLVREKVCLHMCPYARFQSVMFDEDTRTISYDRNRGEPRTAGKSGGDCVDCHLCVHVCPTGIDIRNGLQADCIACGACIDICDQVMTKLQRPTGLIRFISANHEAGKASPLIRPRLIGYFGGISLVCAGLVWGFVSRDHLLIDISRDRQHLYQINVHGEVCNDYRVTIENIAVSDTHFTIQAEGPLSLEGPVAIQLPQGQRDEYLYRSCAGKNSTLLPHQMVFRVQSHSGEWLAETTFIAPR